MDKRGRVGRPRKTVPITAVSSAAGSEFFKVFLPQTCSYHLRIPPAFVKNLHNKMQGKMILKHTGVRVWHVNVEKTRTGVFIKNGWRSFVIYHCLKAGEFLVFSYDGKYSLHVKIFGINGCERECPASNNIATPVRVEENDEEEIEAELTSRKRTRLHNEDDSFRSSERTGIARGVDKFSAASKLPDNCEKLQNDDSVNPNCPHFILTYNERYKTNFVIPREVIRRYNPHLEPEMLLRDPSGREWHVKVIFGNDRVVRVSKGWSIFRKENNIAINDRCKFTFDTVRSGKIIYVQFL